MKKVLLEKPEMDYVLLTDLANSDNVGLYIRHRKYHTVYTSSGISIISIYPDKLAGKLQANSVWANASENIVIAIKKFLSSDLNKDAQIAVFDTRRELYKWLSEEDGFNI